jgi:uncharacterized SAM-binding protein YcdF (DUF218 family)
MSAAILAARQPTTARCCIILRRAAIGLAALVIVGAVALWFGRESLLRSAADWWIVSDPVGPADAVAVLGGGLEARPFAAADYYRRGLVKTILISNVGGGRAEELGGLPSHVMANRQVLLKLGVSDGAIQVFGSKVQNTRDEVLALHDWAERTGAKALIVPTEVFTTRRLSWMLHQVFDDEVTIRVPALDPDEYDQTNWWHSDHGIISFQNEVLKYLYYRIKY